MIAICDRSRQNKAWGRLGSKDRELGVFIMGRSREEIDLELALRNPERAREYIAKFDWGLPDPPKYVVWDLENKIWFNNMTDAEAVTAAFMILRDVDIPQTWRTAEMLEFEMH